MSRGKDSSFHEKPRTDASLRIDPGGLPTRREGREPLVQCRKTQTWDHSGNITDFIRAVLSDRAYTYVDHESSEVLSSLRSLVQTLEEAKPTRDNYTQEPSELAMPPLEAILEILRWVKGQLPD